MNGKLITSLTLNVILLGVVLVGFYLVVVRGSVSQAEDGRTAVHVTAAERIGVLEDMRGMLEGVQAIAEATAEGDMAAVETAARALGSAKAEAQAPSFMAKLPLEFKTLGLSTHAAFDSIADAAAAGAEPQQITAALGEALLNCTACHASYLFDVEAE